MNTELKKLMKHLLENNYVASDVLEVFTVLSKYETAQRRFQKSTTPESEALARWNKSEVEQEWVRITRLYDLPKIYIHKLIID